MMVLYQGRGTVIWFVAVNFVGFAAILTLQSRSSGSSSFERGLLPPRWTDQSPDCAHAPAFRLHEYNPTFFILRQSGCTHFEKPFLYLLLGSKEALLVDTGARGADVAKTVGELVRRKSPQGAKPLPVLVIHSHGHGDHTAGDPALRGSVATRVIDAQPHAIMQFFGLKTWPGEIAQYDLGDRVVDVLPIPGHEGASVAIYDRRTRILLTGDTLYPGRLYVRDARAFVDSIDRLVDFTRPRGISHILGAHIENTRTPYLDYPEGTTFQPEEHVLELGRAHLLELQDALRQMGNHLERRSFRDFTIWPVVP
jgi:glyoxylase-like metal-dependent hydrolase (beta-lactamase superfamily II)